MTAYNHKIPSGNEVRANDFWTPGGVSEAVMDFSKLRDNHKGKLDFIKADEVIKINAFGESWQEGEILFKSNTKFRVEEIIYQSLCSAGDDG